MKIFLIGFMGVGKTTIGKRLARQFNIPFVDLDAYITEQCAMPVADLFTYFGEAYFRTTEQQCLHQVLKQPEFVLACGGGTASHFDNMKQMNDAGLTIYLESGFAFLFSRIRQSRTSRPLVNSVPESDRKASLEALFENRKPFYEQARMSINVEKLVPAEALEQIVKKMIEFNML